ncbi:unnamed protein product [Ostreobium quekettii]|uniref:phosphatidylinositol 3-kinase n=1 Tax=Ostreobium quekettii TaxID=121088 RepID=A0A8S1IXB3_9CHLO|nr:unnamed protein product [Ostreobium quekettii]|eukprot:evm.model.scf_1270.1 EVM.evm.TU.scf_1270.1   scf_1270:15488-22229(-)
MPGSSKPSRNFTFYLSCDIDIHVQLKVVSLCGPLPSQRAFPEAAGDDQAPRRPSSVYVVARLCDGGETMGLDTRSRYWDAGPQGCRMGEWLSFCVKYKDLPDSAVLAVSAWELAEARGLALVGGATMPLFNKRSRLKTGEHKLNLWPGQEADPHWPSATPGKVPIAERGEMGRLENLKKRYIRGDMQRVEWLDRLTFREIDRLLKQEGQLPSSRECLELVLQLPRFPHDVLYQSPQDVQQPLPPVAQMHRQSNGGPESSENKDNMRMRRVILDPEVGLDNPVENKAQKLARNINRGIVDKEIKPDVEERRRISEVLKLPPNKPINAADRLLLWKFRFSLTSEKAALTKFLKCVDWSDAQEAREAAELMNQWAAIDIADALELLSPDFKNPQVRAHAVAVLQRADDDELLSYLLQLVQALRYEGSDTAQLSEFLTTRAAHNPRLGFYLHWYLFTEWQDPSFGKRASTVHAMFVQKLQGLPHGSLVWDNIRRQIEMMAQLAHISKELKGSRGNAARKTEHLREMLGEQGSCAELTAVRLPLPLEPSVFLTGLIPQDCSVFKSALCPIKLTFRSEPYALESFFTRRGVGQQGGPTASEGEPPGLKPYSATGKKVATPHCLQDGNRCVLIYKKGDDLRQDQFMLQMISLMDQLLKKENLDLKITPYQVLPTTADDGLVEFVKSSALARILAEHKTIQRYFEQHHPDPAGQFGVSEKVISTFVKSCAGYCVMMYILGVGDRHLDNLMLCTDGRLFHIDFGYILGRDPKPFPPPMKLCKEMVEAMGGTGSPPYKEFKTYCCEAYNILRKSANLILSLFHLMAGASIPDVKADPEKAMLKVQERLALHLDDEGAVQWIQQLINESTSALVPQIMEATHRFAQYWR